MPRLDIGTSSGPIIPVKGRIRRRSPGRWQISYELGRPLTLLGRVSQSLPTYGVSSKEFAADHHCPELVDGQV